MEEVMNPISNNQTFSNIQNVQNAQQAQADQLKVQGQGGHIDKVTATQSSEKSSETIYVI